jgi:hypothetical protein
LLKVHKELSENLAYTVGHEDDDEEMRNFVACCDFVDVFPQKCLGDGTDLPSGGTFYETRRYKRQFE